MPSLNCDSINAWWKGVHRKRHDEFFRYFLCLLSLLKICRFTCILGKIYKGEHRKRHCFNFKSQCFYFQDQYSCIANCNKSIKKITKLDFIICLENLFKVCVDFFSILEKYQPLTCDSMDAWRKGVHRKRHDEFFPFFFFIFFRCSCFTVGHKCRCFLLTKMFQIYSNCAKYDIL